MRGARLVVLGASLALAALAEARAVAAVDAPAADETKGPGRKAEPAAPTLEWLRDTIVARGVPARFVRIERPGEEVSLGQEPRLVFWTKTELPRSTRSDTPPSRPMLNSGG